MVQPDLTVQQTERLRQVIAELASRKTDALRLYRPLPTQSPFHRSLASERVVRGGNRSGKSACGFAETASAATGIPITDYDGSLIPNKYPENRPLLIWVVGYDERHIGSTIYRMLFTSKSGLKMIRDAVTNEWRAWRPWDPADLARENETRPMPPLIPARFVDPKGWAWTNKAERVFSICRLKNGNEIHAFSSKGEPAQGSAVDLLHIDEDIKTASHVAEWQARLSDVRGRLIWTAFPHSANEALTDMSARAEAQKDRPNPDVHEIKLRFSDNPFMPEDEKRKRLEGWSAQEAAARNDGEFNTDNVLVYPTFAPHIHGTERVEPTRAEAMLREKLGDDGQTVPRTWTRYLVLDPGYGQAAVLFAAVPPPEIGDFIVCYDELYPQKHDANALAKLVEQKARGFLFEQFIIDFRAGRQTPMGFSHTIKQQYEAAFAACGLRCARSGAHFSNGSDNVPGRIELVRTALAPRSDGSVKLKLVLPRMKNMIREFRLYKRAIREKVVDERPIDRNNHLMNTLEYLLAAKPTYVVPSRPESLGNAYAAFQALQRQRERENGPAGQFVYMGAGSPGNTGIA